MRRNYLCPNAVQNRQLCNSQGRSICTRPTRLNSIRNLMKKSLASAFSQPGWLDKNGCRLITGSTGSSKWFKSRLASSLGLELSIQPTNTRYRRIIVGMGGHREAICIRKLKTSALLLSAQNNQAHQAETGKCEGFPHNSCLHLPL